MSQAQSFANHCMYMAFVLIEHWSDAIDRQTQNASVTTAAFAPAVRLHLLDAYGWQMLACNRVAALPSRPPHHTSRMPVIAEGITVAPEVKELALLEQSGWLATLQKEINPGLPKRTAAYALLASEGGDFDLSVARHCFAELETLIQRFSDAIDES